MHGSDWCVFYCIANDQETRNEGGIEAGRWNGYFDPSKGFVQTFPRGEEGGGIISEGEGGEEEGCTSKETGTEEEGKVYGSVGWCWGWFVVIVRVGVNPFRYFFLVQVTATKKKATKVG